MAAASVLPISVVIMVAILSTSDSRIPAAPAIQPARSANDVVRYVRKVDAARARMRSTSSSEISSKVCSTSPVAGLVVAMGMGHLGCWYVYGPTSVARPGTGVRPATGTGGPRRRTGPDPGRRVRQAGGIRSLNVAPAGSLTVAIRP